MKKLCLGLVVALLSGASVAQMPHQPSAAELYQQVKKLAVLGNVLYLAAHPDDENTRFIAYCANEKLYNTAYLSLTRGDGGQNLIGPEIREELGIIRTQELLAARRTDGGRQYFSRANDFGYSKTSKETQEIWDRDKVLYDMVLVIRQFRPDVIVCRFPPDSRGGHGHHTASAELGIEAFNMSGDPKVFPDQLKREDVAGVWQPTRIVTNTGRWWRKDISADEEGVVSEDIGEYNEVLGTSYNELAARSRSMHKSQGFGATGFRGSHEEFFEHLDGVDAKESLFEGFDPTWNRVKGGDALAARVNGVINEFSMDNPTACLTRLMVLRDEVDGCDDAYWRTTKLAEIDRLIAGLTGLYIEAKANDHSATHMDSVKIDFELVNRSKASIRVKSISSPFLSMTVPVDKELPYNEKLELKDATIISPELDYSQPYWLAKDGTLGTYRVDDEYLLGTPENQASIRFYVDMEVNGRTWNYEIPLIYKWNDPVKGELYRPFVITPPVFVNFQEPIYLFADPVEGYDIEVTVKSGKANFSGELNLVSPEGWEISPSKVKVSFEKKGEEQKFIVSVDPGPNAQSGDLSAMITDSDGKLHNYALNTIEYDHIPAQTWFPKSHVKLVRVNLKTTKGKLIGYLEGAGDVIPESLENIGYNVNTLTEPDLTPENLDRYDAIVLGIRAVNTNERIGFIMPKLLEYTKRGGTLVLQYNTRHRLKTDKFSPYHIKLSRDRVTEEDAEVTLLKPDHPVLTFPNKITKADFDGWVQERGLYFPSEWAEEYETILSWHDQGEDPKDGSLLVAKYGKGHYVYTGISFFRELPAGVPGAYRLLVNLISLGQPGTMGN